MGTGVAVQVMLEGMPDARDLHVVEVDGQVLVLVGQRVIAGWDAGDAPMRNLAAVTLRNLGFTGQRVAQVLGLSEEYVATLRGRARRDGSAGVVPRRGRPPALGARELRRARRLREQGLSDVEISRRLGCTPRRWAGRWARGPRTRRRAHRQSSRYRWAVSCPRLSCPRLSCPRATYPRPTYPRPVGRSDRRRDSRSRPVGPSLTGPAAPAGRAAPTAGRSVAGRRAPRGSARAVR